MFGLLYCSDDIVWLYLLVLQSDDTVTVPCDNRTDAKPQSKELRGSVRTVQSDFFEKFLIIFIVHFLMPRVHLKLIRSLSEAHLELT